MAHLILPSGFRASGTWAGIKPDGRGPDLGLLVADAAGDACAVYTNNRLLGAHIPVCRGHLEQSGGRLRAVLVNSGNANCATGQRGVDDARRLCHAVAERVGCPPEQVLSISTGVIGQHLPLDKMLAAIGPLVDAADDAGAEAFAESILTTDTQLKFVTEKLGADGCVTGVAKGSGMIHPDMATMLAFLLTDTVLGSDAHTLLANVVDRSFHRVTVDGDTSPNDTVLLWSTGRSRTDRLESGLMDVSARLCRMIAADGEGGSRLVTVEVRGAKSEADAATVGRLIATSPLVKTAVAGRDPNWGRILSAAGRAGVPIDVDHARVWVGEATVFADGTPHVEREAEAAKHLRDEFEVRIGVDLASGSAAADVWTCDLTSDYVRINADYRT